MFSKHLKPSKSIKGFSSSLNVGTFRGAEQVGLRGGSGVEERLIIEWMVIERNVLRTADSPKYNAKTSIKYIVEPQYDLG